MDNKERIRSTFGEIGVALDELFEDHGKIFELCTKLDHKIDQLNDSLVKFRKLNRRPND